MTLDESIGAEPFAAIAKKVAGEGSTQTASVAAMLLRQRAEPLGGADSLG